MSNTLDAADGAAGVVLKDASRDPRFTIKAVALVACFALACGLIYLLATRTDIQDRYTSSDAARDWKQNAETRSSNLKALADQRSVDLRAQAEVNALWRESNAAIRATLDSLSQRAARIETKIDAK